MSLILEYKEITPRLKCARNILFKYSSGSKLSSDTIDCIGGIIAKSKDGTMKFDNTLDARIERLKPLIRKEIASTFGVGS